MCYKNSNTIFLFLNPDVRVSFSFFRFFSLAGCIPWWLTLYNPNDLLEPSSSEYTCFVLTSKSPVESDRGGGGGGGKGGNGGRFWADVEVE